MTKLFVTDMDHTLLDDESRVPENFKEILDDVKSQNKYLVLASGRTLVSIKNKVPEYADELCIISDNGAIVERFGKIEYVDSLSDNDVVEILDILRNVKETTVIAATAHDAFIELYDDSHIEALVEYYPNYTKIDDIRTVDDPILKITAFSKDYTVFNYENTIYPNLGEKFNAVVAGKVWVDVMNKHTDKGHALKKLTEILDVNPEDVAAFGDYNNDIGMLTYAGKSYAVANAHDDVKNVANEVIGSNNENSVLNTIAELLQSK